MAKGSEKVHKTQNGNGTDKKKKHTLKKIYAEDEGDKYMIAQPAKIPAVESIQEAAAEDLAAGPRSIFLEDKQPYEPGAGFVVNQEATSLSCSGLDPNAQELWLLQLPLDWRFNAPAKLTVKRRKGDSLLGGCTSETGEGFSLVQEHTSLAAPLYVASPTLKDGLPAQIQRRVTLVRSNGASMGEEEQELPSAQQTAAGPSSNGAQETPKKKKPKTAPAGSRVLSPKELRLEDLVVKQESPDQKQQKEKKKKKKKDKGTPADGGPVGSS